MIVEKIIVGVLETNCYLAYAVQGAPEVVVVDPGDDKEKILGRIGGRKVAAVLLTHGHYDHTGALSAFHDVPIYIHLKDAPMLNDNRLSVGELMGDRAERPAATHHMKEGDTVEAGGLRLKVLHTPGHSMGSVCFLCNDLMFSGDTLFFGNVGRIDFPGSDAQQIVQSLEKIKALEGEYTIYSGHGVATTLSHERINNPFLNGTARIW